MHTIGHFPRKRLFVLDVAITMIFLLFGNSAWPELLTHMQWQFFYADASGALRCNPGTLWFGNVTTGTSKVLSATLSNTGTTSVTIYSVSQTQAAFALSGLSLPLTLAPRQQVSFQITFAPQTGGHVDGGFSFTSSASGASAYLGVHATGVGKGTVSANPASLSFGNLAIGASATLATVLTNSGTTGFTISQISVAGAGFNVSEVALPLRLAVGQSVSLSLSFSPALAGSASGTLSVTSNASNPSLTIPLSGSGASAGLLGASSSSLNFGSVQTGNNSTQPETITNAGGSALIVSQANVTGAGFSISGLNLPLTLVPGQSFTFGVAFAPSSTGSASGSVALVSNATNSSLAISLLGSGIAQATQHSVSLAWEPSGSPVTGYNVYRGTQSGGPYAKVNPSPSMNTAYSDISVQTGQTYFYVTTAVSGGTESGYSNQVQATIPGAGALPGLVTATSSNLSFGGVQVGGSQTASETLTNSGSSSVTISQANVSGAGFSTSGLSLPLNLAPGQSFSFNAVFAPTAAGNASGTLTVVSNASDATLAISLAGAGLAAGSLAIAPSTLSFGNVAVGQSKTLSATLTASGSGVTISSAVFNTREFALGGGISFPLTLSAGQSAVLAVTFTPEVSGTASDSLSFVSNASNSPVTEALGGSGTATPSHSVVLSWTDASSGVAGYNIYRATTSGGPFSKINSVLNPTTTYTDASVQAGQTYFYVATAVNQNGTESAYSSPIQAAIPTP